MSSRSPVDTFIEQILAEKYGGKLSRQAYEKQRVDLTRQLWEQVNRRAIEALSHEHQLAFQDMLKRKVGQDDLLRFMEQHVPNLRAVLAAALFDFRREQLEPPPS